MLDLLAWPDSPLPQAEPGVSSTAGAEPERDTPSAFASLLLSGEGLLAAEAPVDPGPAAPKSRLRPREDQPAHTGPLSCRLPLIFAFAPVTYVAAEPLPAAAPDAGGAVQDGAALGQAVDHVVSEGSDLSVAESANQPPEPPGAIALPFWPPETDPSRNETAETGEDETASADFAPPAPDEPRAQGMALPLLAPVSPSPAVELPAGPGPKAGTPPDSSPPVMRAVQNNEALAGRPLPQPEAPAVHTGNPNSAPSIAQPVPAVAGLSPGGSLHSGVALSSQTLPEPAAAPQPHAFALVLQQQRQEAGDGAAARSAEATPADASRPLPLADKLAAGEDQQPGVQTAHPHSFETRVTESPEEGQRSLGPVNAPVPVAADSASSSTGLLPPDLLPGTPPEGPAPAGVWAQMAVEPPAEVQSGVPPALPSTLTSVELQAPGSAQDGHAPVSVRIEETPAGLEVRVNSSDRELRESLLGGLDQLASRVESQGLGIVQLGAGTGAETADGDGSANRRHPMFVEERRARPRRAQERSTEFSDLITRTAGGGIVAVR